MVDFIVNVLNGPKGRQIGYSVRNIETREDVAIFKNRDHSFNWRRAKEKAEAECFRLNTQIKST